jgi:hypothetical protein
VFHDDSAVFRENISLLNLHRRDQTHLYQTLNVYNDDAGGGGEIGVFAGPRIVSVKHAVTRPLHRPVLDSIVKPSHREASVICKVLGTLTTTFMNQ